VRPVCVTAAKRGLSSEQIPVLVARDRSGATIDAVLSGLDCEIARNVDPFEFALIALNLLFNIEERDSFLRAIPTPFKS
jgi:hypothetical protein